MYIVNQNLAMPYMYNLLILWAYMYMYPKQRNRNHISALNYN